MKRQDAARARGERGRSGFTLVELLATVAILTILISLLVPAIRGAIGSARAFVCQRNLGTVTFDFSIFADEFLHESRGQMDQRYADNQFQLLVFMNNQYRVGEFWMDTGGLGRHVELADGHPLACPAAAERVTITLEGECNSGGILRPQAVSIGFNRRLHQPDPGIAGIPQYTLRSKLLQQVNVPLLWDSDGFAAYPRVLRDTPFSAPSLDSRSLLRNNRYWNPGLRHMGKMNVGFIGGQVRSTASPLTEPGWRWDFQPRR